MSTVNRVILVGNLGRDPEIFEGASGKVAKFSIATKDVWRDKQTGERKETVDWHNVVVFSPALVKLVEGSLRKGLKVCVVGKQKTRSWDDKETGKKRYATETVLTNFGGDIQILTPRGDGVPPPGDEGSYGSRGRESTTEGRASSARFKTDPDDEIPF